MQLGKTIKIFLEDGKNSGIRHAEIVNWTGQAIASPRIKVNMLNRWEETMKPGVYFLFGDSEETGNKAVYIGESEDVSNRIKDHLKNKDFWNEVIFFTNKDENLTKAHIGYLESRLIEIASEVKRYEIVNRNGSGLTTLPRGDRAAMEEFILNIKILLGALGHKVLDPLTKSHKKDDNVTGQKVTEEKEVFYLNKNGIEAKALLSSEGIVVLEGSEVSKSVQASLSNGYRELRENLISEKVIDEKEGVLVFTKDCIFTSSSQAGAVIGGTAISGPQNWKTKTGKTLKKYEEDLLKEK